MDEETIILQTLARHTPGSTVLKEYNLGIISYRVESISVKILNSCIFFSWYSNCLFVNDTTQLVSGLKMTLIYGVLCDFCHTYSSFKWSSCNVQGMAHICIRNRWVKLRMYLCLEETELCGILFFERFLFATTRSPRELCPRLLVSNTQDLYLFIKTILSTPPSFPNWPELITTPMLPWPQARRQWGNMPLAVTNF